MLIHELGHSLGLAHDGAGAMESIVHAGERQLPSAAEVALMQNIRNAISAKPRISTTLVTQYAVAANATLTNGSLNNGSSTGSGQAGWATQGSVTFTPSAVSGTSGIATLNEISTSQTRLRLVFMLNANDRYLSLLPLRNTAKVHYTNNHKNEVQK